jgi:hypothetical protein
MTTAWQKRLAKSTMDDGERMCASPKTYILSRCTEVRFASFFSGGFVIVTVVNPPGRKLAKHTSVRCWPPILDQNISVLLV